MAVASGKTKPTLWVRISKYFREVRSEMRKVSWPGRNELVKFTGIVIVAVILAAIYIGVVDVVFSKILSLLSQIGR